MKGQVSRGESVNDSPLEGNGVWLTRLTARGGPVLRAVPLLHVVNVSFQCLLLLISLSFSPLK